MRDDEREAGMGTTEAIMKRTADQAMSEAFQAFMTAAAAQAPALRSPAPAVTATDRGGGAPPAGH